MKKKRIIIISSLLILIIAIGLMYWNQYIVADSENALCQIGREGSQYHGGQIVPTGQYVEATCTSPAYYTDKMCTACGTTWSEVTEVDGPLSHLWGEEQYDVTLADCTHPGGYYQKCLRENCMERNYVPVAPLGHKESMEYDRAATCTEKGRTVYTCERSNCPTDGIARVVYNDAEPALGHNYQKTTTVAATCTTAGQAASKCTRCGQLENELVESIPALGHQRRRRNNYKSSNLYRKWNYDIQMYKM